MSFSRKFGYFLLPSAFQAGLSFGLLPIVTIVLGPADYGTFALISSVTAVGAAMATAGVTFLLSAHYATLSGAAREELVSTLVIATSLFGLVIGALFWVLYMVASSKVGILDQVPDAALRMALLAMILSPPWSIAYLITILEGRARAFAMITIVASLTGAAAVLSSLFGLRLGVLSLFVGALATSMVNLGGAYLVIRSHLRISVSRRWIGKLLRLTLVAIPTNSLEVVQTVVERAMLSAYVGLSVLGLYSHAQQYRNAAFQVLKASSNSIWPTSLDEARGDHVGFPETRRVWQVVYLCLTLLGVVFAFLGRDIINVLTHGKFVDASQYVTALFVVLMVQFSGKPQAAILYARDAGQFLVRLMAISAVAGMAALVVLVPAYGPWGVITGIFVQQLVFRIGCQIKAREFAVSPFQDQAVILGAIVIVIAGAAGEFFSARLDIRLALLGTVVTTLIVGNRLVVQRLIKYGLANWLSRG